MEGLITLQEIVGILIATVQIAPTFGTLGKILLLQSARTIKLCRCRFSFFYMFWLLVIHQSVIQPVQG